jgi:hypothetical protein
MFRSLQRLYLLYQYIHLLTDEMPMHSTELIAGVPRFCSCFVTEMYENLEAVYHFKLDEARKIFNIV